MRNNSVSHSSFIGSESLSLLIPYSAPGGRSSGAPGPSLAGFEAAAGDSYIPNLPNGQLINLIHIKLPHVTASSIEPRFVISKQRVQQAQAASFGSASRTGLSSLWLNLFSSSAKLKPAKPVASTDLGSFYNNSYQDSAIDSSPSSLSLSESGNYIPTQGPTRHNSMANLKRFFKRDQTGAPAPVVSNLSSSLRAQGNFPQPMAPASAGSNPNNDAIPIQQLISVSGLGTLVGLGSFGAGSTYLSDTASIASYLQSPGPASLSRSSLMHQNRRDGAPSNAPHQVAPFSKRYSKFGEDLGAGAGGAVKLVTRESDKTLFAVKEFRAKFALELRCDYARKITGEYCVGLTLKHPNIIETVEICYENERIYQVMEYCDYDLFAIVMLNKMLREEINCCFKQVLLGIAYIHGIGLAHRDMKLDNCVIDKRGIVKIIDFGLAVVFSYPFSKNLIEALGIVGSDPYLAPEMCVFNKYDPRPVDIWLVAIIYCCMMLKKFPWKVPKLTDNSFKLFATRGEPSLTEMLKQVPEGSRLGVSSLGLQGNHTDLCSIDEGGTHSVVNKKRPSTSSDEANKDGTGNPHTSSEVGADRLLLALPEDCRALIGGMVEMAPACRMTIEDCFKDEWLALVEMCTVEECQGSDNSILHEVVQCSNHTHTQVDQSKAHIAAFDKSKKK